MSAYLQAIMESSKVDYENCERWHQQSVSNYTQPRHIFLSTTSDHVDPSNMVADYLPRIVRHNSFSVAPLQSNVDQWNLVHRR